jgi:hypothetical protein
MTEEELPACTSISPEYELKIRIMALEEGMRRLEEQQREAVNELEKQLARHLRMALGVIYGGNGP